MAQKARADILTRDDLKAYTTWRDKHGWSMTTAQEPDRRSVAGRVSLVLCWDSVVMSM
jgi:hypothetical protein